MSVIIGLDYGSAKIGIATADSDLKLALPWGVTAPSDLIDKLKEVSEGQEIEFVVVGLPLSLSGEDSAQTQEARDFAVKLEKTSGKKVVLIDERFTTVMAAKQGKDDAVAAMHLLQSYLDGHGSSSN